MPVDSSGGSADRWRGERHMRGIRATGTGRKSRLVSVLALTAGLGLAGCSDIDNALFGEQPEAAAPAADQIPSSAPAPGTPGTMPGAPAASSGPAPTVAITPVPIEPGSNTGTPVSATIATLRGQVQTLEDRLGANAAHLTDLRNQGVESAMAYHESKARITTRLQVGTTRGNPELVTECNTAQASLDKIGRAHV